MPRASGTQQQGEQTNKTRTQPHQNKQQTCVCGYECCVCAHPFQGHARGTGRSSRSAVDRPPAALRGATTRALVGEAARHHLQGFLIAASGAHRGLAGVRRRRGGERYRVCLRVLGASQRKIQPLLYFQRFIVDL